MENREKENFSSLEVEELEIRTKAEEKRKSVFKKLRKKTLAIFGSLFFFGSSLPAVSTAEIVEKFKSGDAIVELDKSKEIRDNLFEKKLSDKELIQRLDYISKKIGLMAPGQIGLKFPDFYNFIVGDEQKREQVEQKFIRLFHQKPETKTEKTEEPMISSGLEAVGIKPEIVKEILKTFPPSWLKEVSLITYMDKSLTAKVDLVSNEEQELVARHQVTPDGKSEIYFFQGAKQKRPDHLLHILFYEYAHANNWIHRDDLTMARKIELSHLLLKRVESEDRYKDPSIEKIRYTERTEEEFKTPFYQLMRERDKLAQERYKLDDQFLQSVITREEYQEKEKKLEEKSQKIEKEKMEWAKKQAELGKKTIEYWGAICMQILSHPWNDKISAADKEIVFSYLKLTDPDFKIIETAEQREKIILDYLKDLIKDGILKIEDVQDLIDKGELKIEDFEKKTGGN